MYIVTNDAELKTGEGKTLTKGDILKEAVADLYEFNIQAELSRSCEKDVVAAHDFQSQPNKARWDCDPKYERHQPLPEVYTCGTRRTVDHPYLWECRLKGRLMDLIAEHDLRQSSFLALDVGSLRADWVLSIGVFAPNCQFIAFEPSNAFHELHPSFMTNPETNLSSRVFVHQAAAASHAPYDKQYHDVTTTTGHDHQQTNSTLLRSPDQLFNEKGGWKGPALCIQQDQTGGEATTRKKDTPTDENHDEQCPGGETAVPALPLDAAIQGTVQVEPKSLLFAKIDVEGGEYEALLGANMTMLSRDTRPCVVMIEVKLKNDGTIMEIYDKAFLLLTETYGYTEIEDVDSGNKGPDSYPPSGSRLGTPREGNYDVRLPPKEMAECIARVKRYAKVPSTRRRAG